MKIKQDFVTNSSSTCYIFSSRKYISEKEYNFKLYPFDFYRCVKTKKELIAATNENQRCDWIDLARGPDYYHVTKEEYDKCLDLIKAGKYAIIARLERDREDNINKLFEVAEGKNAVLVLTEEH